MADRTDTPITIAIRLALVMVAVALLWLMSRVLIVVREEYAASFEPPGVWPWMGAVGLGVLAGAAFAAAGRWGTWPATYRFGRVIVLGIIPAGILILDALMLTTWPPPLPRLVVQVLLSDFAFLGSPYEPLAALLLGVALVAGWTPQPDLSSDRQQSDPTPEPTAQAPVHPT